MSKQMQVLPFKRSRAQKTNYRSRLKLLYAQQTRIVVRPSLKDMTVQLIDYNPRGDAVKVTMRASLLRKQGWQFGAGNIPAAYLAGYCAGIRAKALGISRAVLDLGSSRSVRGSRVYAAVKGARDAGLDVPCDPAVLPSDDRVNGKHIAQFAASAHGAQFAAVKKGGASLEEMPQAVATVKEKLR